MDYNARYYSPGLGRFVSPDTVVPEPSNPQALNRYSYVTNNPLRGGDPTGHQGPVSDVPPFPQPINPDAAVKAVVEAVTALSVAASQAAVVAVPVTIVGGTVVLVIATGPEVVGSLNTPEGSLSGHTNPWTGGQIETFPLTENGPTLTTTPPLGGTIGTEGPPITAFPLPEVQPNTFGLEFPSLDMSKLPDLSILESKPIQTGDNIINPGTAEKLNKYFGLDLHPREWGRALERLKGELKIKGNHHGKIYDDGTYEDTKTKKTGNIADYLP
jgi:hypothetical protein